MQDVSRWDVASALLTLAGVLTLINVPNPFVGYGLIIPAMIISSLHPVRGRGGLIFAAVHLLGAAILIYTASMFTLVVVLSLVFRSATVFLVNRYGGLGFLTTSLLIVLLDTLIALSLGLAYFGRDAIDVGLDIHSAFLIPFTHLIYKGLRDGKDSLVYTGSISMAGYFLGISYFPAPLLVAASLVGLGIGYFSQMDRASTVLATLLVIGGALASAPTLLYTLQVVAYPLQPASWTGEQWMNPGAEEPCKEFVMDGVWGPERLRIVDGCVTVEGVVVSHPNMVEDGDIVFDVELDPEYRYMLSTGSYVLRKGYIHVEIVPEDRDEVYVPMKGERVRITGAWVVDTDHGSWAEIHPAWRIEVIEEA